MSEYGLGRIESPDARDLAYPMRSMLAEPGTALPESKTWAIRPTALFQGSTSSCVGHAWANFLRCAPMQTNANIDKLRFEIYDAATKLDVWAQNDNDTERSFGTSVRAGAEAVMAMGRLKSYLWAFDLQTVVEYVLTHGSVVLGTRWYTSMFHPNDKHICTIGPADKVEGGHAYLLRGVNTRRAIALCSNSWGDGWGKSGEFFLPFHVLERLIHEAGECCVATEQRPFSSKVES